MVDAGPEPTYEKNERTPRPGPVTVMLKPKWDKWDTIAYREYIYNPLYLPSFHSPITNFKFIMSFGMFGDCFKGCRVSIPNYRYTNVIKNGPKRVWLGPL